MRQMRQEHDINPTNETASKRLERSQLGHESGNNRKIHRRDAEGAEMDDLVESIGELAGERDAKRREEAIDATKPTLQEPVKDPARLEWHEVTKVAHYYLSVNAMTRPMQVREAEETYGENG